MKMRKTVYPIAVVIAIPLVLILFIILNQGHFEQVASVHLEHKKAVEAYFRWKGFGNPTIQSVKLASKGGQVQLIDYHTAEEDVIKAAPESVVDEIEPHSPSLSVRIEGDTLNQKPATTIIVHYNIFGVNQEQKIESPP